MSFVVFCTECDEELIDTDNATLITQQLLDEHENVCSANDEDED